MRASTAPYPAGRVAARHELGRFATPKRLPCLARHNWYFFPHSYDPALVDAILDECAPPPGGSVLDPFVGAGTTLLAAQRRGLDSVGIDLSPLSVLAAKAKTDAYDPDTLTVGRDRLLAADDSVEVSTLPDRLQRAFTVGELRNLLALRQAAETLPASLRAFFVVAVLQTAREFSRAVPNGGWFKWVTKPDRGQSVRTEFAVRADAMIQQASARPVTGAAVEVYEGDARCLPEDRRYNAVVTSPPYPNRHDYTRVFHIELLLLGLTEPEISALRRRMLRSHPEARHPEPDGPRFVQPAALRAVLDDWPARSDGRVPRMIAGYFEDMHTTIVRISAALQPAGVAAIVVGNVRHAGRLVPVDEILVEAARQAGLTHRGTWVLRERGNSAQQMGRHGRVPSRESVIFLAAPSAASGV